MFETCERYDISMDRWAKYPPLNIGRAFHSSCGYEGRFVFVMCGLVYFREQFEVQDENNPGISFIKEEFYWRMSNTIEMFDSQSKAKGWVPVEIPETPLTVRRSPGLVQINAQDILIFGGSSDKTLKAIYRYNVNNSTIRRINTG